MKSLRIYYDTLGNIIYHIGLEGEGDFPKTIEQELAGLPEGTACLTITDLVIIESYYHKTNNTVVDGELVLGDDLPVPPPQPPPLCTRMAKLISVTTGERPARVEVYMNKIPTGFEYDCYVSETVLTEYTAGRIVVGDFLLVEFVDDRPDMGCVFAKAHKTW
uniref:Uncharacterized protein n=1 Tax=viral metagenome TaxID=1070528 RepID=A0A6M3K1A6_9ZZZZ